MKRILIRSFSVCCVLVLLTAAMTLTAAQVSEDRTPTGGSNITTRKCVGGTNAGTQCNDDSDCDSNNCFDYNIVDLTVNFRTATGTGWTPTAAQMATIQGYWTPINNAVADITDGQMVLGTVSLIVNNGAPNAVVQLNAGQCSAGAMGTCVTDADCAAGTCNNGGGSTNTGGWGANGQITVGVGCLQNPLCFVHEFMHLIANVRDEYEGAVDDGIDNDGDGTIDECQENQSNSRCFGGTTPGAPCSVCGPAATNANAPCSFSSQCNGDTCNLIACPGGGTCRGIVCIDPGPPAGPTTGLGCLMRCCLPNTDSELCWAGNHDPARHTEQDQCRNGNDCWTQFGIEWPTVIQVPAGAPAAGPAVAPAGVGFLTPSVLDRFVAVIDRSDSMDIETPRRIDVAVTAVKDFIDLLSNGTDFGLASFSSSDGSPDPPGVDSSKDFPSEAGLRSLSSAADRSAAKTAADGLSTRTGGLTRIGAGLLEARDMLLEAGGTVTLNTSALLLTDGINNRPTGSAEADLDAALTTLSDAGIPVFVTCIGAGRDSVQCSNIADRTAGRFVDSVETDSLYDAFVEFAAQAEGKEISCAKTGVPIVQDELSMAIPALVEVGATEARFIVSWTKASSDLDLRLFRPDSSQVPTSSKIQGSQGESYLIASPEAGTWTMRVFGASVSEPEKFSVRAIVEHQELSAAAGLAKSTVEWPNGFHLSVNPAMGLSIADCTNSVLVERPDGTTETVELMDDGTGVDTDAHDGLYQAEYRNFTAGDGIYTFTVTVHCNQSEASFHQHEDPGVGTFPVVPSIPSFERVIRFSGTVTGVPDNLPPMAEICQDRRAECEGVDTAVMLDGTCSSDPEGQSLSYQWSSSTGTFADSTAAMPTGLFPLGFNDVFLVVTDPDGASSDPDQGLVVIADTTPPEIEVSVAPTSLWPPNHKLVDVVATVTASDTCDPDPMVVLESIVSNEPDDGLGDGDTPGDVQGASFGEPDTEFQLREERAGAGPGRVYTVTYTVTDESGNSASASADVTVEHDQAGSVAPGSGFTATGESFAPDATEFDLVLMSGPTARADLVDGAGALIGNSRGRIAPLRQQRIDYDCDGRTDLVITFSVADAQRLRVGADADDFLALRYSARGTFFLVDNIFDQGSPVDAANCSPSGGSRRPVLNDGR
jgi:hypothetical protein